MTFDHFTLGLQVPLVDVITYEHGYTNVKGLPSGALVAFAVLLRSCLAC